VSDVLKPRLASSPLKMGNGELEKVMYSFTGDMQSLFPALASTV
jgi:hypothetical protein